MARILALDFGLKRTGLAVTDPLKIIATSLATIETQSIFQYLQEYLLQEEVECLVVGDPRHLDNTPVAISAEIDRFIGLFSQKYPSIPVKRVDERFTSIIAKQSILAVGKNRKARKDKSLIDRVSAVIILQSYLENIQK